MRQSNESVQRGRRISDLAGEPQVKRDIPATSMEITARGVHPPTMTKPNPSRLVWDRRFANGCEEQMRLG
jgi:hypothetical protein